MATANKTTENMKAQAETAMNQGRAAMEDMTAKSREAMERGVKSMEEMGGFARGNVEAMVEAGKVYAEGTQSIAREQMDFAKKTAEELSTTMQKLPSVKTPAEAMEMQGNFVRGQFDAMVHQTSTVTEHMFKLMGDVMAPIQNRMAVAGQTLNKVA
ncbi:MAG: phasin family protein [Pseudomonadota bacterium]